MAPTKEARRVCQRFYVSGRVQGIFFRASTAERARALGITGWARNLTDGRVEVLACGSDETVEALTDWLWRGPKGARVENVETQSVDDEPVPADFSIG